MSLPDPDRLRGEWANWFHGYGFGDLSESMADQVVGFIYDNIPLASPRKLTEEEKSDARDIFEGKMENRSACYHCAGIHHTVAGLHPVRQPCPRVKSIKWDTAYSIQEVEYWPNGEWESDILFSHEVYDEDDSQ